MIPEEPESEIAFGPFRLLRRERRLIGPSGPASLSSRAFEILLVLLDRPDRLVTKEELLDRVWLGLAVEENNLQVHMSALRKVLGRDRIATVSGRGYKYVGELPCSITAVRSGEPWAERADGSNSEQKRAGTKKRGNLPDPLTSMVGREEALVELLDLVMKWRAVTIVGLGGIGKTRLAIEAAHQLAGRFVDGAWLVDFCTVQDGSLVPSTIAKTLGIPMTEGAGGIDRLAAELTNKKILIVLDNCEHLIGAAAIAVEALLRGGPQTRILATSREPLEISGERLLHLRPLECAPAGEADSVAIRSMSAVRLFIDRLGSDDVAADDRSSATIADICRTLDGIPLAIEMAASRALSVGLDALAAALHSRLRLQMTGQRTALPRHRTLQATLDWSGDLLEAPERALLRRLAVFPGRFDISGAHAVCAEDGLEEWEVAERLGALVRKSLVAGDNSAGWRFRLLDTVRAYAAEKLAVSGEEASLHLRHARWTLQRLGSGLAEWERLPDSVWLERFGPDLDDCRAALRWADMQREHDLYAKLAGASYRVWIQAGLPAEGLAHARTGLQRLPASAPPALEIQARIAVAELAASCAMQSLALETILPALPLCRALGDPYSLTMALVRAGFALWCQQKHDEAFLHYREAAEVMNDLEQPKLTAWATMAIGLSRCTRGDLESGTRMCETALQLHRSAGEDLGHRRSLLFLAECMFHCGDNDAAIAHGRTLAGLLRSMGLSRYLSFALCNLAAYLLVERRAEEAGNCLDECYGTIAREPGSWLWCAVQNYALLAAQKGNPALAAQLLGYVDRRFSTSADDRQRTEEIVRNQLMRLLREILPAPALDSLKSEGAVWSQRQVDDSIEKI